MCFCEKNVFGDMVTCSLSASDFAFPFAHLAELAVNGNAPVDPPLFFADEIWFQHLSGLARWLQHLSVSEARAPANLELGAKLCKPANSGNATSKV